MTRRSLGLSFAKDTSPAASSHARAWYCAYVSHSYSPNDSFSNERFGLSGSGSNSRLSSGRAPTASLDGYRFAVRSTTAHTCASPSPGTLTNLPTDVARQSTFFESSTPYGLDSGGTLGGERAQVTIITTTAVHAYTTGAASGGTPSAEATVFMAQRGYWRPRRQRRRSVSALGRSRVALTPSRQQPIVFAKLRNG